MLIGVDITKWPRVVAPLALRDTVLSAFQLRDINPKDPISDHYAQRQVAIRLGSYGSLMAI